MNSLYNLLFHTFDYDKIKIMVIVDLRGVIWFRAKEIAYILKYKKTRHAIRAHVDKEDRRRIEQLKLEFRPDGIANSTVFINEFGFYCLVFSSQQDEAKKFRKWAAREVFPSIRKTGMYIADVRLRDKIKKLNQLLRDKTEENQSLKHNQNKDKFSNGGIIYISQPSDIKKYIKKLLKVGRTWHPIKRKYVYNTSTPNDVKYLYSIKINNPYAIEQCVKSILYPYRYRKNKEFYTCPLKFIIKAITKCIRVTNDKQYKCMSCSKSMHDNNNMMEHVERSYNINSESQNVFHLSFVYD